MPKLRYSLSGLFLLVLASAVGIAAYRYFYYVPPLDQISGLQILGETERRHNVVFDKHATRRTAVHLIGQLKPNTSLWFYDSVYDSPSDPGAFVEIALGDGEYLIELRNHGWSTDWFPITRGEAVDLLWACRHDNGPESQDSWIGDGMRLYRDVQVPGGINRDPGYAAATYVRRRISP